MLNSYIYIKLQQILENPTKYNFTNTVLQMFHSICHLMTGRIVGMPN